MNCDVVEHAANTNQKIVYELETTKFNIEGKDLKPLFDNSRCTEKTIDVLCDIVMDKYRNSTVKRLRCVNYDTLLGRESISLYEKTKHVFFSVRDVYMGVETNFVGDKKTVPMSNYNLVHVDNVKRLIKVYDFSGDTLQANDKTKNIVQRILHMKANKGLWTYKCVEAGMREEDKPMCGFMVPYVLEVLLCDIRNDGLNGCRTRLNYLLHHLYFDSRRVAKYAILLLKLVIDKNCLFNPKK